MQPLAERGVLLTERKETSASSSMPDWESVRIFLEVVRHGSFRSAAEYLGQSVNVLRRGIEELEVQRGPTVLTGHVEGVRPPPEGEQIFAAAEQREAASLNRVRAGDRGVPATFECEVKLAVTEGL